MPAGRLALALSSLGRTYRAGARRRLALRLLTLAMIAAWLLIGLDALAPMPGTVRIAHLLLMLGGLVALAMMLHHRFTAARSFDRMVARQLEMADPALGNTLINALDFQPTLAGQPPRDLSRVLMEHEVASAAALSAAPTLARQLRRSGLRFELKWLGSISAGSVILAFLLWPVLQAVIPRYLDPRGDHPPYHPTRLSVSPGDAAVDYGDALSVNVTSQGPQPKHLELVICDTNGQPVTRLPLYESAPGTSQQTIEHITGNLMYYAAMAGGRSPRYRVHVVPAPRLDTTRVLYEYPAYTRLRAQTRFLTDRTIRAYPGTWVTLTLTANRPLRGGRVTLNDQSYEAGVTEDANSVSARFQLTRAGDFEATLIDTEGSPSREPLRGKVELLRDRPPEITLVAPGVDAFATPLASVPLNIEARDDLGIKSIQLYCRLNESQDTIRPVFEHEGGLTFANANPVFDFADLGVQPGDVVDYYVSATDTDPDQPHTAVTKAFQLKIISEDDYRTLMQSQTTAEELRQQYESWAERLRELAEAQRQVEKELAALREQLAQGQPLDTARQARLADLEAQQAALAREARQLAAEMEAESASPALFDVERDFKKRLGELAHRVVQAAEQMQQGAQAMDAGSATADVAARQAALARSQLHQQNALRELGQSTGTYEQSVGTASREIEEVFALFADVEQFKYLLARQQDVERQSASLRGVRAFNKEAQARLRELSEEERSIGTELLDLQTSLVTHAGPVEKDYPKVAADARALAARMAELNISGSMEKAADAFRSLAPSPGHAAARKALDDMESLVSRCQGAGGEQACELRLRINMNMALGNTFAQLAQSLSFGEGAGQGAGGAGGLGQRGRNGGGAQQAFHVYGTSESKNATRRSSAMGRPSRDLPPGVQAPGMVATDTEEISVTRDSEVKVEGHGEEGVMGEYERLIQEYFRRMSEE